MILVLALALQVEAVERQLTELYGPLLFELESARIAYEDVLKILKRERLEPLNAEEAKLWTFRLENDLKPRKARVAALVRGAEDVELKARAERYAEGGEPATPKELGTSVRAAFAALKKRHAELLAKDPEAAVRWTERQIRELYEPLVRLNAQGLAAVKGYTKLNADDGDQARWKVWALRSFLPRNEETRRVIAGAAALVEGEGLSEPFLAFLEHQQSWAQLHLRWEKEKVDYAWGSRTNWPVAFSLECERTYQELLDRRARLVAGQK